MESPHLQFKSLIYERDGVRLINNLSGVLLPQELMVVEGPSGHGKSTLLKLLVGLDRPIQGEIQKTQFLYLPQDLSLCMELTVLESLDQMTLIEKTKTPFCFSGRKKKLSYQKILHSVGLNIDLNKKIKNISGGEAQRVSLARVFLSQAPLVLLDEPLSQVDEKTSFQILFQLKEHLKKENKSAIIVLHQGFLASEFADKKLKIERENRI